MSCKIISTECQNFTDYAECKSIACHCVQSRGALKTREYSKVQKQIVNKPQIYINIIIAHADWLNEERLECRYACKCVHNPSSVREWETKRGRERKREREREKCRIVQNCYFLF